MPKSRQAKNKRAAKRRVKKEVAGKSQQISLPPLMGAPKTPQMKGPKGTGLSMCAQLYAKALVNPWGEFAELPCVPCTPPDMTKRFRVIHRGSFATGTAGVGFVSWSPTCAANDINSIFASLSTYAGTNFSDTVGATVQGGPKSQLPYASTDFGTAGDCFSARLVASCMRIVNTTAPLYRSGSICCVRLNTGSRVASISAAQCVSSLESVKIQANTENFAYWPFIPQDEEDYDFPDGNVVYTASTSGNRAAANYGFLVQGGMASPNFSTFDWELVEFWEFAGIRTTKTVDSLQKSHSDNVGLSRVLEAVSVPRQSLDVNDQAGQVAQEIVDAMAHSDTVAKTVEDLLGLAGMSLGSVASVVASLTKSFLA